MEYTEYSPDVFTVSNFLSSARCKELIEFSEAIGFGDAPITTVRGFEMRPEIRNNTRVMLDDFALASELWDLCKAFIPQSFGDWYAHSLNERFRFYRYEPLQAFRWHSDGAFYRSNSEASRLTFMVYLNDEFEGGHTDFTDFQVLPKEGTALCFKHPLVHEGAEIIEGVKYVLRTDVMYRLTG